MVLHCMVKKGRNEHGGKHVIRLYYIVGEAYMY